MGPVEILFITIMVLFGVIGIVRGFHRELGITAMLLLALFLIEFAESRFGGQLNRVLGALGGADGVDVTKAVVYALFLNAIAYISYQGQTLSFPGSGRSHIVGFLVGLLNGYLLAGSIWYYMDRAGWPALNIHPPFTAFYQAAVRLLPPAVLDWPFLIALVALMLILRVWR